MGSWGLSSVIDLIKDLGGFVISRKKFWMIPLLMILVVLGTLLIWGQSSVFAPFIYTLF